MSITAMLGSFAIWGTLFSICDCSFTYIRKKEDPWNAIASGAATGGNYPYPCDCLRPLYQMTKRVILLANTIRHKDCGEK